MFLAKPLERTLGEQSMNGFERCMAVLKGQTPDCVPVVPENYLFSVRHCGYQVKDIAHNGQLLADCIIKACEDFGYDGVAVDLDNAASAEFLGCGVMFRDNDPAVVDRPVLESLDQVESLTERLEAEDVGRWNVYADCVARLVEKIGKEKLITAYCDQGPFAMAAIVRGMEKFMFDLCDPDLEPAVMRLIEICSKVTERFARLLIDRGAHVVAFGDAVASPDVISPTMYRQFALPFEKQVLANLQGGECLLGVHICGNTTPIIDDLLANGADLYDIDYKTDLQTLAVACKKRSADKLVTIRGPLDPSSVLCYGDEETVRAKSREAIEILGVEGGLILSGGCDITAETPPANIRAMVEVAHAHKY